MAFKLDVVVDMDAHFLPFTELERTYRKRIQRGLVHGFKGAAPRTRQLAEGPCIEPFEQLRNSLVELGKREELAVAQRRQDPALDQHHTGLSFGLVTWAAHGRGDNGNTVVRGQIGMGGIEVGLVAVCLGGGRAQVIGHHNFGRAAQDA